MASGDHSPEYMIFRFNFDFIEAEIYPVLQEFATKSFQKNLISRDNLQSCNRLERLLRILLDAISVDSSKFHEIIGIMKSLPELEHLADVLQHDLEGIKGVQIEKSSETLPRLGPGQLRDVLLALKDVVRWDRIFLRLGMPAHVADTIKKDTFSHDISKQKREAVRWWLSNSLTASWKELADALLLAGHKQLASQLYEEHKLRPGTKTDLTVTASTQSYPSGSTDSPESSSHSDPPPPPLTYEDERYKDVYFFGGPIQAEITSSGGQVDKLEDVGISLTFPEGALKPCEEPLKIVIRPAIGCPLQLPDGYKPASPVYFIEHRGNVDFLKTVNVKIKHWVKLNNDSDCENMDIFSSKLVPSSVEGRSVYKFSKVKGRAVFSLKNSVGAVELSHFCALMDGSPEGAESRCSVRFYKNLSPAFTFGMKLAVICICLDQGLLCTFCDKAISRGYTGFVEKEEGRSVVPKRTFKGETVTIQVAEGWRATFDIKNPKISKCNVYIHSQMQDDYETFKLHHPDYPPKVTIDNLDYSTPACASTADTRPFIELVGLDEECGFFCQPPPSQAGATAVAGTAQVTSTQPAQGPKMKYFHLIEYKEGDREEKFELVSLVSGSWKKIGILIDLTFDVLENYEKEKRSNPVRCWERVMQDWLDGQGSSSYPITWNGLYKLLRNINKGKVAQDLEKAVQKAGLGD